MKLIKFLSEHWEPTLIVIGGIITLAVSVKTFYNNKAQERQISESQKKLIVAQEKLNKKQDELNHTLKESSIKSDKIIELQTALQIKSDQLSEKQQENLDYLTGGNSYPFIDGKIDGVFVRFNFKNEGKHTLNRFQLALLHAIDYEAYTLDLLYNDIRLAIKAQSTDINLENSHNRLGVFSKEIENFKPQQEVALPEMWLIQNRVDVNSLNISFSRQERLGFLFYCSSVYQQWIIIVRVQSLNTDQITSISCFKILGDKFKHVKSITHPSFIPSDRKVDKWMESAIVE